MGEQRFFLDGPEGLGFMSEIQSTLNLESRCNQLKLGHPPPAVTYQNQQVRNHAVRDPSAGHRQLENR
jgi:hypothetical protein